MTIASPPGRTGLPFMQGELEKIGRVFGQSTIYLGSMYSANKIAQQVGSQAVSDLLELDAVSLELKSRLDCSG